MEPDESGQSLTGIPLATARLTAFYPPRKELAMLALLRGATLTDAAENAGVTRQTLSGWVNGDEAFAAEYAARRREMWESVRRGMEARVHEAVEAIGRLLQHQDPYVRLGACRVLVAIVAQAPTAPGETAADVARRVLADTSA